MPYVWGQFPAMQYSILFLLLFFKKNPTWLKVTYSLYRFHLNHCILFYQPIKVLRVLSYHNYVSVCAQRTQFHSIYSRDSVSIVTPFMRDTNYVSRGFATLEALELRLPFTFVFGQVSHTIFNHRGFRSVLSF